MRSARVALMVLLPGLALAQTRPTEADLFGGEEPVAVSDAGSQAPPASVTRDEAAMFGDEPTAMTVDGGVSAPPSDDRDFAQLSSAPSTSKFDTAEVVSDPLKVGGNLFMYGQGFFQERRPFEEGGFSAPMLLDVYLDGRPNDRLRAYAVGRLQFDPTRPTGTSATSTVSSATSGTGSLVGLTPATATNPSVFLDQLWLRFDVARKVYFTVGRQKIRWGVSRIWYPTDFLNSRPRDALNPFDVRLGVNMVKVHVPVESLGWNFYAYGLLDAVNVNASGIQLQQLGGAVRAEFVLGPAELGIGGVWQQGRRQRYAVDLSSAVGPFDVYAEAAFRDGQDFVFFDAPEGTNQENLIDRALSLTAREGSGVMVQVSGGVSWQFNYTENNFGILGVEYFFNPAGYDNPTQYQIQTFGPSITGKALDPIQSIALYQGKHNIALTLAAPGIPGADWITISLSNIVIISDPAGLTRLDLIFRVLNYLSVQVFASVFYGAEGGQLRFRLTPQVIGDLANLSEAQSPGTRASVVEQLRTTQYPPLVQAGVLLRLAI